MNTEMYLPMDSNAHTIVQRKGPDFGLDGDIPRYWFGGDAFKSRFFDAMSLLFPEGEKFFIACVRDYRDGIDDPELAAQVKDFMYQEGQHGIVHTRFNNRLKAQGIAVDHILERQKEVMFGFFRRYFPKTFTLGQTAAAEHMTALMAHGFFGNGMFDKADPRIRAMYAWHAVEEIEHKAVAFDVYKKVARGGYLTRILSMLQVSFTFPLHVFLIMAHMFKVDGLKHRPRVWIKGLWWLYGPGGLYPRLMRHYLSYFRPGFHPWQQGQLELYHRWVETFERSGDAITAADAVMEVTVAA
ncbi:metal-dependent hydrolase [Sinimarinibacterium sp. CAU 1509]|uniref:metal-dependent hydrolase n=1 Tax=Sinimarinibacterium sp. CAU 1509 TaxID=2562283 RepID=UPI0010AD95E1|nr:metal-dependent hydrolase [Sinimarinibacterium sp. CAU 1509]TJY60843.1 metal-dependent hydrolase [Sinimarinibacterium sp. CAU 1509]